MNITQSAKPPRLSEEVLLLTFISQKLILCIMIVQQENASSSCVYNYSLFIIVNKL